MRLVLQRVSKAEVTVAGQRVGSIGVGLVVLLGVGPADTASDISWLVKKCVELRIFEDSDGKMNRSVQDVGGSILLVSQFTLYGRCNRGRRPDFTQAASPEVAEGMYQSFGRALEATGIPVEYGVFGAHMKLSLTNDGPVTILLERTDGH
ncbi:MAG: D-tyrosyl-tRNA(Tyr) deacylase [Candidatus Cloacimonetes bacterium]|nr:D-tyrosyl-tRNA(Tyr) deacylase [Candidatus Cloacimonadota bacterium]